MNKIFRAKIWNHDIYIRIGKRTQVLGINSDLGNGESALFWEFDNMDEETVLTILEEIQNGWDLPRIYLLQASTSRSWHAVCLSRYRWLLALAIVAQTPQVDPDYIRLAAYREHFTLRLSDKGHGKPFVKHILESPIEEDCAITDFQSGVRYGAWVREGALHA